MKRDDRVYLQDLPVLKQTIMRIVENGHFT